MVPDVYEKIWDGIKVKKGYGNAGDATDEEKNAIIAKSVSKWETMGLTTDKIAFGIAAMRQESGFYPHAKGLSTTEYGLGQFPNASWDTAVKYYNAHFRGENESTLDAFGCRSNLDAQIAVVGAWASKIWDIAEKYTNDKHLTVYRVQEIAYGLWHAGPNASAADIAQDLERLYKKSPGLKEDFLGAFEKSKKILSIREWIVPEKNTVKTNTKQTRGATSGETLKRDGNRVYRIEKDGVGRGYFISQ